MFQDFQDSDKILEHHQSLEGAYLQFL